MTASVAVMARLTLTPTSIGFPDSDPVSITQIPATPGPVSVTVKARATQNATVRLTLRASDDLRSGVITIPATNVTWTASGAGFVPGTLNRVTAQTVGTWIGSGVRSGTQSFLFANSWTYAVGTYTLTMQYTLTAP